MEDKILEILENNFGDSIQLERNKATEELLNLFSVNGFFTKEQMYEAYKQGYMDEYGCDFDINDYR